jgi:hypothetical protein
MAKKKSIFSGDTIFSTPFQIKNNMVCIEFPKEVLKYLKVERNTNEIFWYPTNNIIQLSGIGPQMIIPIIPVDNKEFVPQSE